MRQLTAVAGPEDAGRRVKTFVRGRMGVSYHQFAALKVRGGLRVNGAPVHANYPLLPGDVVTVVMEDAPGPAIAFDPTPVDVVWEDENVLLVNKRPGVLSHTGDERGAAQSGEAERSTLVFAVKSYLYEKGEYDPDRENSFAPALCNRIDRNTGGIVIAAKNASTLRTVNEAIKRRDIKKFYLCAVHGIPDKREATATAYLIKDEKTKKVAVFDSPRDGAKKIVTSYRVLKTDEKKDLSLLEVELGTGRTLFVAAAE